jgi:dipeptidyl aminopeptidase/acylaminoacyl peptidase
MAQPFDPDRRELTADAFPVAEDILIPAAATALGVFSASDNGVLAYQAGGVAAGLRLVWRDRAGQEAGVLGDEASYWDVRVSPDGELALVMMAEGGGGNADAWLYEIARNLRTRLTFSEADEWMGAWSPDAREVYFGSSRGVSYDLYRKTVAGAEAEELLYQTDRPKLPSSVSPDGRSLLFSEQQAETSWDLWVLPLDQREARPRPFLAGPFDEAAGMFSPDGRWVAYHSNESGRSEVYITSFPEPGRKWQASTEGGLFPEWRTDGRELFFVSEGEVVAVDVEARGEGLVFGRPRPLFPLEPQESNQRYSPSPDGQRFLAIERVGEQALRPVTVVVNWTARAGH